MSRWAASSKPNSRPGISVQAEQSLGDDVHVNLVGSAVDGLRMAEQVGPRLRVVSGAYRSILVYALRDAHQLAGDREPGRLHAAHLALSLIHI